MAKFTSCIYFLGPTLAINFKSRSGRNFFGLAIVQRGTGVTVAPLPDPREPAGRINNEISSY